VTAFERAAELFERLTSLGPDERSLELAREPDAEVRALVADMLAGDAAPHAGLATGLPGVGALIGDALDGSDGADGDDDAPRFSLEGGPYRVLGVLARGGMGVVLRGRDERLGRDVAIKVLRRRSRDAAEARLRFVEEAQVAGQLEHPGIVPIYHLGEDDRGRPFFVMKLVEGETLQARLAARASAEEDRGRYLALFLRVCQTVAYAHARHVIHRDLKPANVMIGAFGEVQVLDWGLAKVLGAEASGAAERATSEPGEAPATVRSGSGSGSDSGIASVTGTVMGTPRYMPPEQANGDVELLDRRSDVFSLGAILCEVLTGEPPFTGDREAAMRAAREGRLEPAYERLGRCGADPALVALAERSLAVRPEDRPADAGALASGVQRSLDEVERRAHEAEVTARSALARAEAERRAKRMTVGLVASAACFAALLAGAFLWRAYERERDTLRLSGEVAAALDVADERFAAARAGPAGDTAAWEAADLAITAARGLLAGGDTTEGVQARLRSLEARFAPARAEAVATAERLARDRTMVARLDDVRAPTRDGRDPYDYPAMNAAYRAAFEAYGVDVDDPDAAREAVAASAIAPELASALDQWALCNQVLSEGGADERGARTARLLLLAEAANPGTDRTRIRRALREDDVAALREVAADAEDLGPEALLLLAGGLRINADDAGAVQLLREATARYPGDFWLAIHSALAERDIVPDAESPRAIAAFRAAIAARPTSLAARHLFGATLANYDRHSDARPVFEHLVALAPGNGHFQAHLGQALVETGDVQAALDVLAEAVRLAPEDTFALDWYAGCLLRLGRAWSATKWLRRAAVLDPSPATWRRLAPVLERIGDAPEAVDLYRRAIAREPDDSRSMFGAARALRDLERYDEAQELLRRCTEVRPEDPRVWCNLGWVHFDDGDVERAIEAFERGDEIGRASEDWTYPSASWLALARRTQRDIARLPELAAGGFDPGSPRALEIAESARLAGRNALASAWYGEIARAGAALSTLDLLLASEAALRAAAGIGTDAEGLPEAEREEHFGVGLDRMEELRSRLMESFREAPPREWTAVRSFLLFFRLGPAFEPLRGDAVPARFEARVRSFWSAVDADLAEIEAYAEESH